MYTKRIFSLGIFLLLFKNFSSAAPLFGVNVSCVNEKFRTRKCVFVDVAEGFCNQKKRRLCRVASTAFRSYSMHNNNNNNRPLGGVGQ